MVGSIITEGTLDVGPTILDVLPFCEYGNIAGLQIVGNTDQ